MYTYREFAKNGIIMYEGRCFKCKFVFTSPIRSNLTRLIFWHSEQHKEMNDIEIHPLSSEEEK